mmetsp:Transcript_2528/g.5374  ORF Transcript_2528/g.5374 Transcript_2528/m.5374 type:complete len:123 (-) Transcript_2528:267-635(-)
MHKTGDLVEGEEDLLKIIVKWDPIRGAEGYELCHNCNHIDEESGAETSAADGRIYPVGIGAKFECGSRPCNVMPGVPKGHNKFHLRVLLVGETPNSSAEFSPWSKYQNFNVEEPGNFEHEEL